MRPLRPALAAAALAAAATAALAHDFWLSPSSYRPDKGGKVSIRLLVGERLAGEPRSREEAKIEKFAAVAPDGSEAAVGGRTGDDPAGAFVADRDGIWVVAYRSRHGSTTLDAAKFEAYLREEGLERVIAERARLGESEAKGREIYSRCAKALVAVGADADVRAAKGFDRVVGLRAEIVPEANPWAASAGDEMRFRVLFDGKPVEGGLLRARAAAAPLDAVEARTDAEGRATLRLAHAGMWYVGLVHMVRSDAKTTFADWESLWASVTFEVPPPPAAPTPGGGK